MISKTDNLQLKGGSHRALDGFDRKILGEMVKDARQSYADIGQSVGLSAPAVHDRVKRLRASGIISGISACLEGAGVGKPFLAFIHVNAHGWGKSEGLMRLRDLPEVEELHSVTGDACVILKVRTENADAMEKFLARLYALPGVQSTKSYVVLTTYLDRPVQAEITEDWPEPAFLP